MIKAVLNNEILNLILSIDHNRYLVADNTLDTLTINRLRKNSRKKSTYASNHIEGNPLSEKQCSDLIDTGYTRRLLKIEQEIINYHEAIKFLEEKLQAREKISKKLILDVQKIICKGLSKEKIGFRGPMPPGMLFAVYDSNSGKVDYIPPEYIDIPDLIKELITYLNKSDDHPLIKAAIIHYQLVTIHPFEDGNGRTARLLSNYLLDYYGYGFNGLGSLEEYFAYDIDDYYSSLQMNLPILYYEGRDNPPNPNIWITYFLRMVELYSKRVYELSISSRMTQVTASVSHLGDKDRYIIYYLLYNHIQDFRPIDLSRRFSITNKTLINNLHNLINNGFIKPIIAKKRILSYELTEFSMEFAEEIIHYIEESI